MRRAVWCGAGFSAMLMLAAVGRASLYQPDDPMLVPARAGGVGEPFPFDEFRRRLGLLNALRNPTLKNTNGSPTDRDRLVSGVKARQRVAPLTADDAASLGADMLHLGNSDSGFYVNAALDLLIPRIRDRPPNYFVHTTLAQIHAVRGEWAEAATYQEAALLDCELPPKVKGWTAAQREWVARLDRDCVPKYLRIRKMEAETRPRSAPETEGPTPLFPLRAEGGADEPIQFANDRGAYEPGVLSAVERAKLPADAVAVVQQLLLWNPTDSRLYWLLAELYAVEGHLSETQQIMDECVSEARQYGNRKILVEHRAAVRSAVAAKPRSTAREDLIGSTPGADIERPLDADGEAKGLPIGSRTIWAYFGTVAAVGLFAASRAIARRRKGHRRL